MQIKKPPRICRKSEWIKIPLLSGGECQVLRKSSIIAINRKVEEFGREFLVETSTTDATFRFRESSHGIAELESFFMSICNQVTNDHTTTHTKK